MGADPERRSHASVAHVADLLAQRDRLLAALAEAHEALDGIAGSSFTTAYGDAQKAADIIREALVAAGHEVPT